MVTRRLDTEERSLISPGSVYVWEERGPHAELTGVSLHDASRKLKIDECYVPGWY
jgi:hypothetical protein